MVVAGPTGVSFRCHFPAHWVLFLFPHSEQLFLQECKLTFIFFPQDIHFPFTVLPAFFVFFAKYIVTGEVLHILELINQI